MSRYHLDRYRLGDIERGADRAESVAARTVAAPPSECTRVYIAAASEERGRAALVMATLRNALGDPNCVTYDWTPDVSAAIAAGLRTEDLSRARKAEIWMRIMDAIESSHVVWLLAPEKPETVTRDAWGELCAALAMRRKCEGPRHVIVSGPTAEMSVAVSHADFISVKDSDALQAVVRIARHQAARLPAAR